MKKLFTSILLAVALLTGCASTGTPSAPGQGSSAPITVPRDFGEGLVYGYTTNATVRRGAAAALNAGIISKADAQHVLNTTNTVRTALDEARKAGCPAMPTEPKENDKPACLSGLPATTVGKLSFAVGLADQALAFLKTSGAVK